METIRAIKGTSNYRPLYFSHRYSSLLAYCGLVFNLEQWGFSHVYYGRDRYATNVN
jgi:hypothetical protein